MEKETLYGLINMEEQSEQSDINDLKNLIEQYPYFQTARLLYLKNATKSVDPIEYADVLEETALFCADRKRLFYLIEKKRYARFLQESETQDGSDRTKELLDTFLDSLHTTEKEEEAFPLSEKSIVATDYFSFIESMDNASEESSPKEMQQLKHHDIIDDFIEKSESSNLFIVPDEFSKNRQNESSKETDNVNDSDSFLTETLARIYIKQQKYEQALAIIKRLSLNFPKKSVYFADQIRFLEYLIINEKNKKQ